MIMHFIVSLPWPRKVETETADIKLTSSHSSPVDLGVIPATNIVVVVADQFWSGFVPVDEGGWIHPISDMTIFTPFRHFDRLRASSFFKLIFLISSSTWFFQGFLGCPLVIWPSTLKHNTFLMLIGFKLATTAACKCILDKCPYIHIPQALSFHHYFYIKIINWIMCFTYLPKQFNITVP